MNHVYNKVNLKMKCTTHLSKLINSQQMQRMSLQNTHTKLYKYHWV